MIKQTSFKFPSEHECGSIYIKVHEVYKIHNERTRKKCNHPSLCPNKVISMVEST